MNTLNALLAKQPCSPDFGSFVDELDAAGSVSEIYKEMIKARPEVALKASKKWDDTATLVLK